MDENEFIENNTTKSYVEQNEITFNDMSKKDMVTKVQQENNLVQNIIQQGEIEEEKRKVETIKIRVNGSELIIKLENNSSVNALVEKLKSGNITINAHEYGEFEKVGNLGFSLPTNDTQIKTTSGDLMLYQGNQITLFYGSNSWNYTRLGKIVGTSEKELKNILEKGYVILVLSID